MLHLLINEEKDNIFLKTQGPILSFHSMIKADDTGICLSMYCMFQIVFFFNLACFD